MKGYSSTLPPEAMKIAPRCRESVKLTLAAHEPEAQQNRRSFLVQL
jgi:hypothetical protein